MLALVEIGDFVVMEIQATARWRTPPRWARLERDLFEDLNQSVTPFLERYACDDGTLIWKDEFPGRDGSDDFYESCYNWPLLYLLGGGDHLLPLAKRQWNAITRQLTELGHTRNDYEIGYDWFHQGEGNLFFYFLSIADPRDEEIRERARRFADLYVSRDVASLNYDPTHRIIKAPHNGSGGPRWGFFDGEPTYRWTASMARYGLPFHDVSGVHTIEDLKDATNARRMGQVMQRRMGRGDAVANLAATSLVTNAYALTGDQRYRRWVLDYVAAWTERAAANGGLIPDNVDLTGVVGEDLGGKWYGGLYGWTWPHGYYNVGMAAMIAAENALLMDHDQPHLDLARSALDAVMEHGSIKDMATLPMSLSEHWVGQRAALGDDQRTYVTPYRFGDVGWFDEQPLAPFYPAVLWHRSQAIPDWDRVERLRRDCRYDWRRVFTFRTKEDAGHEAPWLSFLAGDNPSYPEAILVAARESVAQIVATIRSDQSDLSRIHIHHWQEHNPITTEALLHLTLGAPQVVYNGGLLIAPLRYFDGDRRRPGLPNDIAALVTAMGDDFITVRLVNLSAVTAHRLVIQAGGFHEHRFTMVQEQPIETTGAGPVLELGDSSLMVCLPVAADIVLRLGLERYVGQPTSGGPDGI